MTPRLIFNSRCDIETAEFSQDEQSGQSVASWTTVASSVPCRLRWRDQAERLNGKTRCLESDYILYLSYRAVEPEVSRVIIAGKTLRVIGARDIGGAGRYTELYLREVTDAG